MGRGEDGAPDRARGDEVVTQRALVTHEWDTPWPGLGVLRGMTVHRGHSVLAPVTPLSGSLSTWRASEGCAVTRRVESSGRGAETASGK